MRTDTDRSAPLGPPGQRLEAYVLAGCASLLWARTADELAAARQAARERAPSGRLATPHRLG